MEERIDNSFDENVIFKDAPKSVHKRPFKIAVIIKHMCLALKFTYRKILDIFKGNYGLKHPNQIGRIVHDEKVPLVENLTLSF